MKCMRVSNTIRKFIVCGVMLSIPVITYAINVTTMLIGQVSDVEIQTFENVPTSYAINRDLFRALFERAHTEPIRIAIIGDSQETSPGGQGSIYIPRLNYEAYLTYGSASETRIQATGSYGGGSPYAAWLTSGSGGTTAPFGSPYQYNSTYLLPNTGGQSDSTKNSGVNINGQAYGQLNILRANGLLLPPTASVPTDVDYFCKGADVRAQIFAPTRSGSGEFSYLARPTDLTTGNYFVATSASGTLVLGLDSTTYEIKSGLTDPLPFNGFLYQQLEVNGNDDARLTNFIGSRFISSACNRGMIIQDLAAGGYRTTSIPTNHSNAGPLFNALNFHAAIIHTGTNDIGANRTPEQFRTDLQQLIALFRTWTSNPNFPIIFMIDIYRTGITDEQQRLYAKYTGAAYQIAQSDPYTMLVNSRLLTDQLGLNADNPAYVASFLSDGVHYTAFGAITLAEIEMTELLQ